MGGMEHISGEGVEGRHEKVQRLKYSKHQHKITNGNISIYISIHQVE